MARAHVRALRTAPRGLRCARSAARSRDRPPGPRALGLALAAFGAAIRMWADLERGGIRHLHVHFAGSPTHVAMLVCRLRQRAPRGGAWTWSVSVHGPVEFDRR